MNADYYAEIAQDIVADSVDSLDAIEFVMTLEEDVRTLRAISPPMGYALNVLALHKPDWLKDITEDSPDALAEDVKAIVLSYLNKKGP